MLPVAFSSAAALSAAAFFRLAFSNCRWNARSISASRWASNADCPGFSPISPSLSLLSPHPEPVEGQPLHRWPYSTHPRSLPTYQCPYRLPLPQGDQTGLVGVRSLALADVRQNAILSLSKDRYPGQ